MNFLPSNKQPAPSVFNTACSYAASSQERREAISLQPARNGWVSLTDIFAIAFIVWIDPVLKLYHFHQECAQIRVLQGPVALQAKVEELQGWSVVGRGHLNTNLITCSVSTDLGYQHEQTHNHAGRITVSGTRSPPKAIEKVTYRKVLFDDSHAVLTKPGTETRSHQLQIRFHVGPLRSHRYAIKHFHSVRQFVHLNPQPVSSSTQRTLVLAPNLTQQRSHYVRSGDV